MVYYVRRGVPVENDPEMGQVVQEVLDDTSIHTVVLNAYWLARGVPTEDLKKTIDALASSGKQVFVTDGIPDFLFDATECKYGKSPLFPIRTCEESSSRFENSYASFYPALQAAVSHVEAATMLNTTRYFCNDVSCRMTKDGNLLYRDGNHLNEEGSRYLATRLLEDYPQLERAMQK